MSTGLVFLSFVSDPPSSLQQPPSFALLLLRCALTLRVSAQLSPLLLLLRLRRARHRQLFSFCLFFPPLIEIVSASPYFTLKTLFFPHKNLLFRLINLWSTVTYNFSLVTPGDRVDLKLLLPNNTLSHVC